jgi:hypothetical protein
LQQPNQESIAATDKDIPIIFTLLIDLSTRLANDAEALIWNGTKDPENKKEMLDYIDKNHKADIIESI